RCVNVPAANQAPEFLLKKSRIDVLAKNRTSIPRRKSCTGVPATKYRIDAPAAIFVQSAAASVCRLTAVPACRCICHHTTPASCFYLTQYLPLLLSSAAPARFCMPPSISVNSYIVFYALEPVLLDPRHFHDILDPVEPAVFLPVSYDVPCLRLPYSGKGIELIYPGGVYVNQPDAIPS